uniref:Uncharacterized protein n=1 Tax=Oryza sativa subsp. japonica TaxID=39947 RepID=Q5Z5R3_ORYSJ|nr:hypothetical protein [Oryza sativa Japonica Group]
MALDMKIRLCFHLSLKAGLKLGVLDDQIAFVRHRRQNANQHSSRHFGNGGG